MIGLGFMMAMVQMLGILDSSAVITALTRNSPSLVESSHQATNCLSSLTLMILRITGDLRHVSTPEFNQSHQEVNHFVCQYEFLDFNLGFSTDNSTSVE